MKAALPRMPNDQPQHGAPCDRETGGPVPAPKLYPQHEHHGRNRDKGRQRVTPRRTLCIVRPVDQQVKDQPGARARSEEHTSELQSLMRNSSSVFCLKKKILKTNYYTN